MSGQSRPRGRPPHPDILTPAEWRVLDHVREGMTNAEIAERLGVSIHAVKFHVSNMLSKLDLGTRDELASWDPRGPRRGPLERLAGLLGHAKLGAAWRVPIAVGVVGAGLGAAAAIAALGSRGDDPAPPVAAVQASPSVVPIPAATPSLVVTAFELTQHELSDIQIPGASPVKWETYRLMRYREPGETFQSNSPVTPDNSQPRSTLIRGTTQWLWGPDLSVVVETDLSRLGGGITQSQLPGWPYGRSGLREMVEYRSYGRPSGLLGEEVVAGRPAYVIRIAEDQCAPTADLAGPITLWVDKETLFVLKEEQRSRSDGRITMLREVTEITYNPTFSDADFALPSDLPIHVLEAGDPASSSASEIILKQQPTATGTRWSGADGQPCPTPQDHLEFASPPSGFQQWTLATATPTR